MISLEEDEDTVKEKSEHIEKEVAPVIESSTQCSMPAEVEAPVSKPKVFARKNIIPQKEEVTLKVKVSIEKLISGRKQFDLKEIERLIFL